MKKIFKWLIKFGGPTYLIFVFVIIVFVDEVNLDINTLMEFAIMSPIGILFLSPIGKFYHHCFINMKDYNKETYELAKDTAVLAKEVIKDSQTNRDKVDKQVMKKNDQKNRITRSANIKISTNLLSINSKCGIY